MTSNSFTIICCVKLLLLCIIFAIIRWLLCSFRNILPIINHSSSLIYLPFLFDNLSCRSNPLHLQLCQGQLTCSFLWHPGILLDICHISPPHSLLLLFLSQFARSNQPYRFEKLVDTCCGIHRRRFRLPCSRPRR